MKVVYLKSGQCKVFALGQDAVDLDFDGVLAWIIAAGGDWLEGMLPGDG